MRQQRSSTTEHSEHATWLLLQHATLLRRPGRRIAAFTKDRLAQFRDVLQAIDQDASPAVDGPEGRRAVEIILGIYKAAETGSTIELPLASLTSLPSVPLASVGTSRWRMRLPAVDDMFAT